MSDLNETVTDMLDEASDYWDKSKHADNVISFVLDNAIKAVEKELMYKSCPCCQIATKALEELK